MSMTPADLKAWRARLGFTQEGAAGELGVSREHYNRLEAGKKPITRMLELATAEISRRWLTEEEL